MTTRREILKLGLCTWIGSSLALQDKLRAAPVQRAPKHVLLLFLRGGYDAILSTDPRRPSEVATGIDLPYQPEAIVEAAGLRLGPELAPLAPFADDMVVLNGVQVNTANHITGAEQTLRLRTGCSVDMPGILDIIGHHREGPPIGCTSLGYVGPGEYSAEWFAEPIHKPSEKALLSVLDQMDADDLRLMARSARESAQRLRGQYGRGKWLTTATNLEASAGYYERITQLPRFRAERWFDDRGVQENAELFQRTLWLFENDLSKTAYMRFREWDTHVHNRSGQDRAWSNVLPAFVNFLSMAKQRAVFDDMLIVIATELGRFPRLNGDRGKDHFPQASFVLLGRSLSSAARGKAFGITGREMEALPIRFSDGRAADANGRLMTLDDLGTTLLHLSGVNPKTYGYTGTVLEFLA